MAVRLNGWQRLWIVASILYLVPVVAFIALSWPTAATTEHRDAFIARLPVELRAHVGAAYDSDAARKLSWKSKIETTIPPPPPGYPSIPPPPDAYKPGIKSPAETPPPPGFTLVAADVSFPNGAILQIHVARNGDTEPDARVAPAYWAVVEAEARAARWTVVWHAFLIWFVPCLSLYALGWSVAWVRRGFRSASA